MKEYEWMCQERYGDCSPYAHAHCSACDSVVNVEPCCGDTTCHAYGYENGNICKTCKECVLCDECGKETNLCPHCTEEEAIILRRALAYV